MFKFVTFNDFWWHYIIYTEFMVECCDLNYHWEDKKITIQNFKKPRIYSVEIYLHIFTSGLRLYVDSVAYVDCIILLRDL